MRKMMLIALCVIVSAPSAAQQWTQEELAAGIKQFEFERYVPPGRSMTLDWIVYLNPDCSAAEGGEITITKEPEHGTASIESVNRFPSYAKDNVRSKCSEKKVPGLAIVYKAGIGYVGTDTFEISDLQSNGMVRQVKYTIHIKESRKGG